MSSSMHDLGGRRRARARAMRIMNVPMRVILGLRVATPLGGRLMLAFITGRKTGRHYRQPLSYVRDGDTLLTPGGGRWTMNLLDGHPVRLRLRGRDLTARPEFVRDPGEVEILLNAMAAASPSTARFVPLPRDQDGRLEPAALTQAIEHGFGIVRWHLQHGTQQ
jgi:F420H(2)-dependent quinone reductase